jgi:hypothetical protein
MRKLARLLIAAAFLAALAPATYVFADGTLPPPSCPPGHTCKP